MSETDVTVAGVPDAVIEELAQALAERIDVLLDRLTDRALAAPQAGSPAWRAQWRERGSLDARQEHARRLYVRAVLANRAGIGLTEIQPPIPAAPPTPAAGPVPARRRASRARTGPAVDQLTMF